MDLLSDKLKKKLMKETDGVITEASPPSATIAMPKAKAKAKAKGMATTTRPDGEKEAVMKLLDDLRKDPDKGITDAKTMCREAKKMNPKVTLADVEEFFSADPISHIRDKRGFNSYIADFARQQYHVDIAYISSATTPEDMDKLAGFIPGEWRWRTMMLCQVRMRTRGRKQTRGREGRRRTTI